MARALCRSFGTLSRQRREVGDLLLGEPPCVAQLLQILCDAQCEIGVRFEDHVDRLVF